MNVLRSTDSIYKDIQNIIQSNLKKFSLPPTAQFCVERIQCRYNSLNIFIFGHTIYDDFNFLNISLYVNCYFQFSPLPLYVFYKRQISFSRQSDSRCTKQRQSCNQTLFAPVLGQRTNGKQCKCIDTCNFRAAEMLVGVPPNPLDFWPP